uniref:DUF4087 domain-containing protein n=1 Tax=Leptospira kirschneri TaxID=29507 RepID=UPI000373A2B0
EESSKSDQFETRCGWLVNPTHSNIWLHDRDAEWIITIQGSHQVSNDWEWPSFKSGQWIQTNPGGYGCACLRLRVIKETHKVLEIKTAKGISLKQCRKDPALN